MAKFYGAIGFVVPMETAPDVYTETPVARYYMGDVIRNVKKATSSEGINDNIDTTFADNNPYSLTKKYVVMVVTKDPDSDLPMKIAQLPMCTMNRAYPSDNLYHYVFDLYF